MEPLLIFFAAILISFIGALPFGLVNLTVVKVSIKEGAHSAMRVAHGAAWVEVMFGLVALLAGSALNQWIQNSVLVNIFVVTVLLSAGLYFLLKKEKNHPAGKSTGAGFLKGVSLNLISLQVFIYWIIAMTFVYTKNIPEVSIINSLVFAAGIFAGKIFILWLYVLFSLKVISNVKAITTHINSIMGGYFTDDRYLSVVYLVIKIKERNNGINHKYNLWLRKK